MALGYKAHELRVVNERADLKDKLDALDKFIHHSDLFKGLPTSDGELLILQYDCMKTYLSLLSRRIERFEFHPG